MSSSHWEIDVSDQETVNGEVPLSPVFREIPCIPPIVIESSISEVGQLTPKVHVRVEETVEPEEPQIGSRYTHVKSLQKDLEVLLLSKGLNRIDCNGIDMLEHKVTT